MKSFKFRMQTVLDQRERQETVAKLSLAEAEAALQRGETFLAELREVRAALLTELGARRDGSFDPLETRLYQEYLQIIAQSIREQEDYVRELMLTREAHQIHLISTTQKRQALHTVKDRDQQAHRVRLQRAEQVELDEIATARYNYQQRIQEP